MRLGPIVLMGMVLAAGPAFAQGPYVTGTISSEIVRTTKTTSPGSVFNAGSGEAVSGSLRVGTLVAPRFGLELEYYRPGVIDADANGPVYIASASQLVSQGALGLGRIDSLIFPPILNQNTEVRASTVGALLFVRQPISSRVDLVYLGGIGFSRVSREVTFGFPGGAVPLAGRSVAGLSLPYSSRTTQYGAGPMVGIEARIGMTEHARLVTGLRVHTLGQSLVDGWMLRPSVGLSWQF